MSTITSNYNLIKPELTDAADITATNQNWDAIDEELKNINDNTWSLQGGTAIAENADLNAYTTPGNYTCSSSNTAGTLTNAPITKVTFTLKVFDSTGTGARLIQEFIPSSLDYVDIYPNRYVRSYYNGNWTAWDKIPYMSQVMPKSGGTFTGTVKAQMTQVTGDIIRNINVKDSSSVPVATQSVFFTRK